MKPKIQHAQGKWWCSYLGARGCGETPEKAYRDMCNLREEAMYKLYQDRLERSMFGNYTPPRA